MKREALGCLLGLCVGHSVACDRSWREEQFTAPGEGPVDIQEPPRVRPSVAPSVNPEVADAGETHASTTAQQTADGGGLEVDASVEPGQNTVEQPTDSHATSQEVDNEPDTGDVIATSELSSTASQPNTSGDTAGPEPFSKPALLRAAGECALKQYETFAEQAFALSQAVEALTSEPARLPEAQQAFVEAVAAFQIVEQFRVGPAARAMDPGGEDLRDRMYAYPQLNRCQIDRNLVSEIYASDFDAVLINARGLGALEYLLFERGNQNACSGGIDINVNGTWDSLSPDALDARRAAYATLVASDIAETAMQLVDAWLPSGGNFLASLADAGDGSTVFVTDQAALNALSHALFYIEKEVKDYKLGWPLGLVAECTSGSCPGASELPYSGQSGPSIAQNLKGFRLLFEGCGANYEGVGFDDWLRAADPEGDLAQRMLVRLSEADATIAALPRSLEDAFYDAPDEAVAVHAAVKGVTDLLKTEFVTVLNLDLPMTAEGDND